MNATIVTDRKRTLIFINIVISCIASSMLSTALTTALPAVIKDLDISVTTGQWLTSGYSLAMGIMMPLTAFLITRFPTRKLYLSGLFLFIVGLALCVIAPNFPFMMFARVLQACGNGILTTMAQVIILSIFPIEKRGTAMGWYGLSVGAAPVIAPTLAGVIVDLFNWRAIFYLAIAIVSISFIYAWFVLDNVLDTAKKKFDMISFALSAIFFGGITLGVGNIGSYDFFDPQVLLTVIIGGIAAILFIYRQLHIETPFLELRILSNKNYAISVIGSMLLYFVMMGSSMIMPLYVQNILGYSATLSGLVVLPGSIAMAIISPFAGKIYDKAGMKLLFVIGATLMAISSISLFFITMNTSVWIAGICNVIRCVAIGCLMMPLVTWGTSFVKKELISDATALLTSLRTVSGAIGIAVFVSIMNSIAKKSVTAYGKNAPMHGLNITYLCMGIASALLLFIALTIKRRVNKDKGNAGPKASTSPKTNINPNPSSDLKANRNLD